MVSHPQRATRIYSAAASNSQNKTRDLGALHGWSRYEVKGSHLWHTAGLSQSTDRILKIG